MKEKNTDIKLNASKWAKPKIKNSFGFFKGLTKILFEAASIKSDPSLLNVFNVSTGATEMLESCGFEKQAGQIGWQLISRSLIDAFFSLISESVNELDLEENFFDKNLSKLDKLDEKINTVFENSDYYFYPDFFKKPEQHPLLDAVNPVLKDYLKIFGFDKSQRENILRRLKNYFVFSLIQEWRNSPGLYKQLVEALDSPFADAENKSYQWLCYRQTLIKEIYSPVFQETFSLNDIYIPLRAYYEIKKDNKNKIHEINTDKDIEAKLVNLDEYLSEWINRKDKNDCLKIISGGPGYGKSSLLKMFAAKLAGEGKNVLFIPLHRFELKSELEESIKSFLNYDKCITTFNPIDEDELVIIFDGLDELDMQGGMLADIAQKFVWEVKSKVDNYNHISVKLKVIISGRDVIVQQNESFFRKEGQHLKLLPYLINDKMKALFNKVTIKLNEDQRDIWWKKYGTLKGKRYNGIPNDLKKEDLDEITAQPLLNYLVALSYERKKIDFTQNINLNKVYEDLLDAVYVRAYSSGGKIKNISSLSKVNFVCLLEEIAVSAWHGNGRKTSIREIKEHFDVSGLNNLMDQFAADAEKGVISLLAAFYFRQAGMQSDGSQTFEFTHKSFGEYLMARRITDRVKLICRKIQENKNNLDDGWDIKEGLKKWIKLFGPKILDDDIVKFIRNEVKNIRKEELEEIQSLICDLINYELQNGLPVEREENGISTYKEESHYAINAERGLFVLHSLIAMQTDICSNIKWMSQTEFGTLLRRIVEQREGKHNFMYQFFNHLNLDYQKLYLQDLYNINFFKVSAHKGNFNLTNLSAANLSGAKLSEANLLGANLSMANLSIADLSIADLSMADLSMADLIKADLIKADLTEANLAGADLTETYLFGTKLMGVDLSVANLTRVDLSGVVREE